MEKMNQVSVSEFFAKSKEEMYDDAVAMVEKYNRLVDICNDSAERMAELMAKDDINEFKKELQSREPGELKIQKLADIVVWADGKIRDGGYNEEKYRSDATTAYCNVKAYELWRIRDVALESMERQTVYSNALNKDIAAKAAKIELMHQELDGRKAGYVALKTQMDILKKECDRYANDVMEKCTYIDTLKQDIEDMEEETEKLKKTIETKDEEITKRCKDVVSQSGTICNLKKELDARGEEMRKLEEKVKHQRENLDGINRTLEIKIKENESLIAVRNNQDKEIEAHESENARLTEKIIELKKERDKHMARVNDLRMELDCVKASKEKHEEAAHDKVVEGLRETITYWRNKYVAAQEEIEKLDGTIEEWKNQERIRTDQLRATESKVEELWKEIEKFTKGEDDDHGKSGFKRYIEYLIEEEERAVPERFKERLNKEITAIFTKEEETEVKGRYPWGTKKNDIPCGEDAIE